MLALYRSRADGSYRASLPSRPRTPAAIAAGEGSVWVDGDAGTVLRVDQSSGEAETLATGDTPTEIAVGEDAVWVANGRRLAPLHGRAAQASGIPAR